MTLLKGFAVVTGTQAMTGGKQNQSNAQYTLYGKLNKVMGQAKLE